jgi:fatty acid desaturase
MLPPAELLPDVLPTDRLGPTGKAVPEIRAALRHIPNVRNAVAVVGCWVQSFAPIVVAAVIGTWWAWVIAFFFMGRAFALFSSLAHEAAHRLLFSNRTLNDIIGVWVVGAPGFVPTDLYRRGHMAHHREEFGPNEPDMNLYVGYPVSRASLRRKLVRDAIGISGWKNLKGLFRGLRHPAFRKHGVRIVVAQVVLMVGFALAGYWWAYWLMWFVPWMTQWRVINRLRAIAEHGGMEQSKDRRRTTHTVRQHLVAKFFMVPYNIGWHLSHHVDIGVPWRNLPRYHRELAAAGWVPEGLEYPSYVALWRVLASGSELTTDVVDAADAERPDAFDVDAAAGRVAARPSQPVA